MSMTEQCGATHRGQPGVCGRIGAAASRPARAGGRNGGAVWRGADCHQPVGGQQPGLRQSGERGVSFGRGPVEFGVQQQCVGAG
jgi:hypothetical protein